MKLLILYYLTLAVLTIAFVLQNIAPDFAEALALIDIALCIYTFKIQFIDREELI